MALLFHAYEYGAVPPVADKSTDPLLPPLHDTLLDEADAFNTVG